MTPMQKQYKELKDAHSDALLLFRMGDFYELFDTDAQQASKILGITLTARGKGENRHPMAGIPYHALPNYLPKLIAAGVKVAIAEQTTQPQPGTIVEREVVKVITPGTILDENSLRTDENNFIAAVYVSSDEIFYCAFTDITTAKIQIFQTDSARVLQNEIAKLQPSEIIIYESQAQQLREITQERFVQKLDSTYFLHSAAYDILLDHFETSSLKGFGIMENDSAIIPAGALIAHLMECQKGALNHIKSITKYRYELSMQLDSQTITNLELIYPLNSNNTNSTLFGVIGKCASGMGQRLLRSWIVRPLLKKEMIEDRQDAVSFFSGEPILTGELRSLISNCYDIERLSSRIGTASASPRDLVSLRGSIDKILEVKNALLEHKLPTRLTHLLSLIKQKELENIINYLESSIAEDPPLLISDLGVIADGFDEEIDELRDMRANIQTILKEMREREIESTGISTLKISFNKVFGYYIEISRSHSDKAPDHYVRKQTLANSERFITQELKELEDRILNSEERLLDREKQLFTEILLKMQDELELLIALSDAVSEIDVLANLGYVAYQNEYSRPEITEENTLKIENGRHPVVEDLMQESFVPNSSSFDTDSYIHLLTGPNMSGKSTYIRQVALLTLMAQMGSFVSADSMSFSIKDRIFTRVGASDNLAKGESTFMVEMNEAANILNNASKDSLIILDEVGRGTSTYDGVAIAWSIVEYIAEKLKSTTLFATHYHELTTLEGRYKSVKNYNVSVEDHADKITFLHKIVEGGSDRSYGIHVAKLAGVPEVVTKRAESILELLESSGEKEIKKKGKSKEKGQNTMPSPKKIHPEQLGLL